MDCAKGINFLLTNDGQMQDYQGYGKATQPMLPSIGVPTTAGTGSEAQSYALITCADTNAKMACGDRKARFHIAILDPNLLASAPQRVRRDAGIDALAHAVESYVSIRRTPPLADVRPPSLAAASAPLRGSRRQFPRRRRRYAFRCPPSRHCHRKLHARRRPRHRHPLTARYPLTHGRAVALMLPHVIRLNEKVVDDLYGELCADIQLNGSALALAAHLEELCAMAGTTASARRLPSRRERSTHHGPRSRWAMDRHLSTHFPYKKQTSYGFTRRRFDRGRERIIFYTASNVGALS